MVYGSVYPYADNSRHSTFVLEACEEARQELRPRNVSHLHLLVGYRLDGGPLKPEDYGESEYDCIPHIRNLRFALHPRHNM